MQTPSGDGSGWRARARLALVIGLASLVARAHSARPVLHEPLAPDPEEDLRLGATVEGGFSAVIRTPSGLIEAPDPERAPAAAGAVYARGETGADTPERFTPDRDTRQPDTLSYSDPFTPPIAPFKRVHAFDAVDASYNLYVRDPALRPLAAEDASTAPAVGGAQQERFFADLVVEAAPGARVPIPSVAPGARVLHARLGTAQREIAFALLRDGADNWYLEAGGPGPARLVMELSAPRAAFGSDFGDPSWASLPKVPPLPRAVAAAAGFVATQLGVGRQLVPRAVVARLVQYFRSFVDSTDPPHGHGDIYLDLALSQRGVCRHRAFAFTVTALSLGIPTRMVMNEAHAWVEIHDGTLWRRVDLGGAARSLREPLAAAAHRPPPDPFAWRPGATPDAELGQQSNHAPDDAPGGATDGAAQRLAQPKESAPGHAPDPSLAPHEERPDVRVALELDEREARRGTAVRVHGNVHAEDGPCAHTTIELFFGDAARAHPDVLAAALATDAKGVYGGTLVVPPHIALGEYVVIARTADGARCGKGTGP